MKYALERTIDGLWFAFLITTPIYVSVMGAGLIGMIGYEGGHIDLIPILDLTWIWAALLLGPYFVLTVIHIGVLFAEFLGDLKQEAPEEAEALERIKSNVLDQVYAEAD